MHDCKFFSNGAKVRFLRKKKHRRISSFPSESVCVGWVGGLGTWLGWMSLANQTTVTVRLPLLGRRACGSGRLNFRRNRGRRKSPQQTVWMFPKIMVPPKSSILIGFSLINHPFWGSPIFGNTHVVFSILFFTEKIRPFSVEN